MSRYFGSGHFASATLCSSVSTVVRSAFIAQRTASISVPTSAESSFLMLALRLSMPEPISTRSSLRAQVPELTPTFSASAKALTVSAYSDLTAGRIISEAMSRAQVPSMRTRVA